MTSKEYLDLAMATDVPSYDKSISRIITIPRLIHAQLGMVTEVGEFTDALKKFIMYGKEIDRVNLLEELGDLEWYIAMALIALGSNHEHIWDRNIAKLKARYPEKFTEHAALNRNLNDERKELEK